MPTFLLNTFARLIVSYSDILRKIKLSLYFAVKLFDVKIHFQNLTLELAPNEANPKWLRNELEKGLRLVYKANANFGLIGLLIIYTGLFFRPR